MQDKTKKLLIEAVVLFVILLAYAATGTMDYNDAVDQQQINNQSATYVNDHNLNKGE